MQAKSFVKGERGQGLVEYALIMVLVAVVVIVILATMGPAISYVYCKVVLELNPGGDCTAVAQEQQSEQGQQQQQQEEEEEEEQPVNASVYGTTADNIIHYTCAETGTFRIQYDIPNVDNVATFNLHKIECTEGASGSFAASNPLIPSPHGISMMTLEYQGVAFGNWQ